MDYRSLHVKTVADLRRIAKEEGVKVPAGTNKALLVQLIVDRMAEKAAQAEAARAQRAASAASTEAEAPKAAEASPAKNVEPEGAGVSEQPEGSQSAAAAKEEEAAGAKPERQVGRPRGSKSAALSADAANDAGPVEGGQPAPKADSAKDSQPAPVENPGASAPAADASSAERKAETISAEAPSTEREAETAAKPDAAGEGSPRQAEPPVYVRQMSTQQRMGARTQPNQGPLFRTQQRPQAGGNNRFAADNNRGRMNRGFENASGFRRNANEQGSFRRGAQGSQPQQPYRRPQDDTSQQQPYRRPQDDTPQQQPYRRVQDDASQQQPYRRPQDDASQQPSSDRRYGQDGQPQPSYRRALTEEQFQQQTGYRRPLQAEQLAQPEASRPAYAPESPAPDERPVNPAVSEMIASGDYGDGAGILEIHSDGYGFLRAENYLPGNRDVYVSAAQIRRFNLRTGDYVSGKTRPQQAGDRSVGLIYVSSVNGQSPELARNRRPFDTLIPVYPDERLRMERTGVKDISLRIIDMMAPIGKGQRGMIVSPPKAGKTTLLKKIANAITANNPDVHLIVLLIDERPEEVTDMQRSISGEVVYSTFDEAPENHTRVSEMVLERAQRLVELGKDVVILLDSITRLARAYNLVIPPTGRSLSGGLDPGALYRPKRFFGAARNIENGGSLTIIATALVDTGSRMDDIIYEEFKGTGNMELHLDRSLSDRRIFPAIDMYRSSTRREELLLTKEELEGMYQVRRMLSKGSPQEAAEQLISLIEKTRTNEEFFQKLKGWLNVYEKEGFKM